MKTRNMMIAALCAIVGIGLIARFYKKPVKGVPAGRMEYKTKKMGLGQRYMYQLRNLNLEAQKIMDSNDSEAVKTEKLQLITIKQKQIMEELKELGLIEKTIEELKSMETPA